MNADVRLVAFDLDGTLTQHRTPMPASSRRLLDRLAERYRLVMVGAGACMRIFHQMEGYPIDIIGNYGMQSAAYDHERGTLTLCDNVTVPIDREDALAKADALRRQFGYTRYEGDSIEFHDSGMVTFPLIGTGAKIGDKIGFDPDRALRKAMYAAVCEAFAEYKVFIGGSSSFDIVPQPYNKRYALGVYCQRHGIAPGDIVYVGDDYGVGGNDEDVYRSDIRFICVDDFTRVADCLAPLLA